MILEICLSGMTQSSITAQMEVQNFSFTAKEEISISLCARCNSEAFSVLYAY